MPTLRNYYLFISHAWKYGDDYRRLVGLLDNASNFQYSNFSAPSDKPLIPEGTSVADKTIIEKIENKIRPVQVVLALAGIYASHRYWIDLELDIAVRMGKPIIGIKPWGNTNVSNRVTEVAAEMVNWNTDSIVTAIRNNAL